MSNSIVSIAHKCGCKKEFDLNDWYSIECLRKAALDTYNTVCTKCYEVYRKEYEEYKKNQEKNK